MVFSLEMRVARKEEYRVSIQSTRNAVVAAFGIYAVVLAAHSLFSLWFTFRPGFGSPAFEHAFQQLNGAAAWTFALATAALLSWFYAAGAAIAAAVPGLVYTPKWSVLGFLIPVLNLVRPYQVMEELWCASRALATPQEFPSWRKVPHSSWVPLWWMAFALGWVFSLVEVAGPFTGPPTQLLAVLPLFGVRLAAAVLTIMITTRVTRFQREAAAAR
jgi:Domain of unknown function (DUF4328)